MDKVKLGDLPIGNHFVGDYFVNVVPKDSTVSLPQVEKTESKMEELYGYLFVLKRIPPIKRLLIETTLPLNLSDILFGSSYSEFSKKIYHLRELRKLCGKSKGCFGCPIYTKKGCAFLQGVEPLSIDVDEADAVRKDFLKIRRIRILICVMFHVLCIIIASLVMILLYLLR